MIMTELHLVVLAGPHERYNCVVSTILKEDAGLEGPIFFKDEEHNTWFPADAWKTAGGQIEICLIVPYLAEFQELELALDENGPAWKDEMVGVTLEKKSNTRVDVKVGGDPLTALHFNEKDADRPYLYPLLGPQGQPMTRSFPMEKVKGETDDHPHHRSVWTAYGEVSGVNHWATGGMVGKIAVTDMRAATSGLSAGRFLFDATWRNKFGDEEESLDETREIRVYNLQRGIQAMDFTIALSARHGDVHFGDTKEGGFLSVRVTSSMDGDKGGLIENCYGAKTEKECWGKPAPWCDYSGTVKGFKVGVAIMNHPSSFRFPTYWHVRDYGLFAANPFGLKAFTDGALNGEFTLRNDEMITFEYRLLVHAGDASAGRVKERYLDYVRPPEIKQI
jgi:hypothetical protein